MQGIAHPGDPAIDGGGRKSAVNRKALLYVVGAAILFAAPLGWSAARFGDAQGILAAFAGMLPALGGFAAAYFLIARDARRAAKHAARLGQESSPDKTAATPVVDFPPPCATVFLDVHKQFRRLADRVAVLSAEPARLREEIRDLESLLDEERARLEERLAQRTRDLQARTELAVTDELTGLPNRREAMAKMQLLWDNRRMHADALAVILLDIDHFKKINDTRGHPAGDVVLKETAAVLRDNLRATDAVCRVGGEEFLVVCSAGGLAGAAACAEKLRAAIERHPFAPEGRALRVTISLGVAQREDSQAHPGDLIREADDRLYAAKNAGRNRVVADGLLPADIMPVPSASPGPTGTAPGPVQSAAVDSTPSKPIVVLVCDDEKTRRNFRQAASARECNWLELTYADDLSCLSAAPAPQVVAVDAPDTAAALRWIQHARAVKHLAASAIVVLGSESKEGDFEKLQQSGADVVVGRSRNLSRNTAQIVALARLHQRIHAGGPVARAEHDRVLPLLLDFSRGLNASFTMQAILTRTVSAAAALAECRQSALIVPDDQSDRLIVGVAHGVDVQSTPFGPFSLEDSLPGKVLRERRPVVINTPQDRAKLAGHDTLPESVPAALLPLSAAAAGIGVLWLSGHVHGRPLREEDLSHLDQLCNLAAAAIADARSRKVRDQAQDSIVEALGKLAEYRDDNTGRHVDRVTQYSLLLAEELRKDDRLHRQIDERFIRDLRRSAPLHDIGKVGIPDEVLLKPAELTLQQRAVMRMHVKIGVDTIRGVAQCVPGAEYLRMAEDIAAAHHEWFNGQGYPQGLQGDNIPLAARIVAVADVYDALTTRRPYKPPYSHEESLAIIRKGSGTQFDPAVIAALKACEAQFSLLAVQLADDDAPPPQPAPAARAPERDAGPAVECYDLSPM